MRLFCLIAWLAIAAGCSSLKVRCDSHLRPINQRQFSFIRPHSAAGAVPADEVKP